MASYYFKVTQLFLKHSGLKKFLFLLVCTGFAGMKPAADLGRMERIMLDMEGAVRNLKTLSFRLKNTERIGNKLLTGEQAVKMSVTPFKCYIILKAPNNGARLLFAEGYNENEAIYDPGGFPYMKLNLDPLGSLMRKNNHHTIYELGFGYLFNILKENYRKKKEYFRFSGELFRDGRMYYLVRVADPDFRLVSYTVQKGENLRMIARKFFVSEYKLLELNPDIDNFKDVEEGQRINMPTAYAREMELHIDKKTFLPVFQKIYDEKGLFEQYEYSDVVINPSFSDKDFTEAAFEE